MRMKLKRKRVLALMLAALMVIGLVPSNFSLITAKASNNHVLDGTDIEVENSAGYTVEELKLGSEGYFSLVSPGGATKVENNSKEFDGTNTYTRRIKLYKSETNPGKIKFTTLGAASVKVNAMSGGSGVDIQYGIYDASGNVVGKLATAYGSAPSTGLVSNLFEITSAGTYYIYALTGDTSKGLNVHHVEVTEKGAGTAPTISNVKAAKNDNLVTVTWDESADATTGSQAKVEYSADNGTTWEAVGMVALGSKTTTHDLANMVSGSYIYRVSGVGAASTPAVQAAGSITWEQPRKAWAGVADPAVAAVQGTLAGNTVTPDGTSSKVIATWTMDLGKDGADSVVVSMVDSKNAVVNTKTVEMTAGETVTTGNLEFEPTKSDSYSFKIDAKRAGETDKNGTALAVSYWMPLTSPILVSATSKGSGNMELIWNTVAEADSYEVSYSTDGSAYSVPTSVTGTSTTLSGLTIGTKYTFKVVAKRAADSQVSAGGTIQGTPTADAQRAWSFSAFGSSTSLSKNGYEGSPNDSTFKLHSTGNGGKIVPASTDGLAFYYTAVNPKTENFTLTADVTVNSWTLSNGQEGFGLMAADRVGVNGASTAFWNNSYMASVTKTEYFYDAEKGSVTDDATKSKITMKLGIGAQQKIGVTKDLLPLFESNDTETVNKYFSSKMSPLETNCGATGAGTYNIVDKATATVEGTIENPIATFKLSIQKNNTGYFISYTDQAGNTTTKKYYDTEALSALDENNVYVGFFASRNADISVSNMSLTTIAPENDLPKEERPVNYVTPSYKVISAGNSNSADYELVFNTNADGNVKITDPKGNVVAEEHMNANTTKAYATTLDIGITEFNVTFTPDADYVPSEFEKLSSYETVTFTHKVDYNKFTGDIIYVSPTGAAYDKGTKANPTDIYTAVKYASEGQTIVLAGGKYSLNKTVKVDRGIDGTKDAMIYMIADPAATERPVFNFNGECAGMVLVGDYWYFKGFDVTNSQNAQKGIQVSGSNCVLDGINTYNNGNTGIQISRYLTTDARDQWPSNDLILNCTSYNNADAGYEDADGFAAKLTVGDGIVFDGCIAYNNADDGWDLFAKVETGPIGAVTIKNSVAYGNGYLVDGTNAGNGNGFKMGGESISGYHTLINSVAFNNKAKGIDSNSCPDIQVENSTSFNNESYNVAFYTNLAANTDYSAKGLLSFKTASVSRASSVAEQIKPVGTQDQSKIYGTSNYYWDGSKSVNSAGQEAAATWFESLDTSIAITRNADGTINMNGLLALTSEAPAGVGARMTGTPSKDIVISGVETTGPIIEIKNPNAGGNPGGDTGNTTVPTGDASPVLPLVMILFVSGAAVLAFSRKKKINVK